MPAWLELPLPDGPVPVVLTRRRRQTIGLRVGSERVEVIAHPQVPLSELEAVLRRRSDWIAEHWRIQQQRKRERLAETHSLCLLGEVVPVRRRAEGRRVRVVHTDGALEVQGVAEGDEAALRTALAAWMKREAQLDFPRRVARLGAGLLRSPSACHLSAARTRWGSCTAQGVIRLNWRLLQAPPAIIDYVVAHELAHLMHMNHSAAFWAQVAALYPDWRVARQWLKTEGHRLFALG